MRGPGPLAPISAPGLGNVRPVQLRAELKASQTRQAQADQAAQAIQATLHGALTHLGLTPGEDAGEQLIAALEQRYPLSITQVSVTLHGETGLGLCFENNVDGVYGLEHLARHLGKDLRVLGGVLRCIERRSARSEPSFGPGGLQDHADYWWNSDRLAEELYDRFAEEGEGERNARLETMLNQPRTVLKLARRLGLQHAALLSDSFPHALLWRPPDEEATLSALRTRGAAGGPLALAWTRLADALAALIAADDALPGMDDAEVGNISGLPLVTRLYTTGGDGYCPAFDLVSEFTECHWQGGEDNPFYALHLDASRESAARLTTALQNMAHAQAALTKVHGALMDLEKLCAPA
ncbi:hypothetical protein BOO71_0012037 [Deinococcus marmoris]|uniref:Uncharacterized protein n=2 Tax=Deinococcus marmoris TaxID=249408 RepID=A0A1U7NTY5_9DEIO|nr:hypothetical protein BOO71_0012037 [Deinococcus marmoris]